MFTSYTYILLRLASKFLNYTCCPREMVKKLNKYAVKYKMNTTNINSDTFTCLPVAFFKIYWLLKANENLSSSFEQKNGIKLCQATWTTHSHSKKFNKMLKNFATFSVFSVLFSSKKATGRQVKLSEFIFVVFILYFTAYLFSFFTISRGQHV